MFFIVGPCALESLAQVKPIALLCERFGISYFRSQIFKPRTHHYSFQGLGTEGMDIVNFLISKNLSLVSEVLSVEHLLIVKEFASIIQIGARNMQNFELLKKIGPIVYQQNNSQSSLPYVLLKRGPANTEEEWLASASYLEAFGVPQSKIILCERGTRNHVSPKGVTLDFALAYKVKSTTNYRVIIDPSHGTRDANLVLPMIKAAISMDFDGVMVEVHPNPKEALSDPEQTVSLEDFENFLVTNGFDGHMPHSDHMPHIQMQTLKERSLSEQSSSQIIS
ncbi:MAG: 3-deoxy-7-phosphoheptulonate synthase [Oligoflexia bacterium]|nr:3-deoxy-7-phosphoheptulonate synthase [Oligoflexia bacterium]